MQDIAVVLARLDSIVDDISGLRTAVKEMTAMINKVVVIEERQGTQASAIDRAFDEVRRANDRSDRLEGRIHALELAQPVVNLASGMVMRAAWMVVSAVIGALLTLVVIKYVISPEPSAAVKRPTSTAHVGAIDEEPQHDHLRHFATEPAGLRRPRAGGA